MRSLTRYLETFLKLTVNPVKSKVAPMNECSFLAFTIRGNKIRWTDKALADFKYRVGELTGRSWGVSMFCTVTARVAARRAVTSMVVAAASSLAAGSSPQRLDLRIPV